MASRPPAIEVMDLTFSYNGHPVLENVNFTVRSGDFLAVIGPNGGGKTTLVKLLLGLLKPKSGKIRILGRPPGSQRGRVGYVPQNTAHNAGVPATVFQVALMGRMKKAGGFRRFSDEDRQAAQKALERMGVWDLQGRSMGSLSGGQRQRALVARALASEPSLLLLDEPMSNVDPGGQAEFYHLLKELNEHVTLVVVSHDLIALSTYVKSVACVSRTLHHHDGPEVTPEMLEAAYQCPVELIAHGVPHRVLAVHETEEDEHA